MRRFIYITLTIIVCFVLQTTLLKNIPFLTISPNLLLIITVSYGLMRGNKEGLFVGFICGLINDIFYSSYLGVYALIFMYLGFLCGLLKKNFYPDDFKLPLMLVTAGDLVYNLFVYIFMFLFRNRTGFGYYLIHMILPEAVFTLACAIPLYFIMLKINMKIEEAEKKGARKFE